MAEIREVFDCFDQDNDGHLNLKEFRDSCQGTGLVLADDEVESNYATIGAGNEVDFSEFSQFMVDHMKRARHLMMSCALRASVRVTLCQLLSSISTLRRMETLQTICVRICRILVMGSTTSRPLQTISLQGDFLLPFFL